MSAMTITIRNVSALTAKEMERVTTPVHKVVGIEPTFSSQHELVIVLDKEYDQPISIHSNYTESSHTKISINALPGARAIINRHIEGKAPTVIEEVHIQADHTTITYNENQSLGTTTQYSCNRELRAQNSTINAYTNTVGASITQHETNTYLVESHTKCLSTIKLEGAQEAKVTINHHQSKNCTSDMRVKAVVGGQSRLLNNGLISIDEQGVLSEGYQQSDILLMSEQAIANSVPELKINNPEVSCSHGSTIGHIDEEQLFYLQSRGLPKDQAEHLIMIGFLNSILTHAHEEWKQDIIRLLGGTRT